MDLRLRKSNAVNFNNLSTFVDNYSSSDDDPFDVLDQDDYPFLPQKSVSQEFTIDLATMFQVHSIPKELPKSYPESYVISGSEYYLEKFNSSTIPSIPLRVEPIECIVVDAAHLEQFPNHLQHIQPKKPEVFAWFDAQTAFPSEYQTTVQSYFKNNYNCIRSHLRFFFSIAPSYDRLQNIASIRREVPAGRILFHYVGHGFPRITDKNIWCSERRSTNFTPFDLEQLFSKLSPPTWFIFDCSNAGVVIPAFLRAEEKHPKNALECDWSNWFCACATSAGEDLPQEPYLPRDFLTSVILTPIKMAIVCHILQHYRTTLIGPKFPLELPFPHLLDERSSDISRLSLVLTSLTDAIAADSLPRELYHKIFRCDRLSAVIFRHFLLAQFLLKPYRVHPISHPSIPDLSMHKLWKQWEVCIDTTICSINIPRPSFATELYSRMEKSFETMLQNDQLELVRPYHLTLLFHMMFYETQNDKPLFLLTEYSASTKSSPEMLTTVSLFNSLFAKLIKTNRETLAFHSLCFLILALLFHNPTFSIEIRKELDVSSFPNFIFDEKLNESTRILLTAILATLVVSHDGFQQICTNIEFLKRVRKELEQSSEKRSQWLLLLIRRAFHLYSPDTSAFVSNGLHVQTALFIKQKSPLTRAAAIGTLTCFLRPFECCVNGQLLLLALPTFMDVSFIVRFHLLLMLKKFIISFDCYSEVLDNEMIDFPNDSYQSLMNSFYKTTNFNHEEMFNLIDELVNSNDFMVHIYLVALYVIKLYSEDLHESIQILAKKILEFVDKQKEIHQILLTKRKTVDDLESEIDFEQIGIPNLDQNESLHQIILHNLILSKHWKYEYKEENNVNNNNEEELKQIEVKDIIFDNSLMKSEIKIKSSIKNICFNANSSGYCVVTSDSVSYFDKQKSNLKNDFENVSNLFVSEWNNQTKFIITTIDGFVLVWNPSDKTFNISFRCSSSKLLLTISKFEPFILYTINSKNILSKWNLKEELLAKEWKININEEITSFTTNDNSFVIGDIKGNLHEMNLNENDEIKLTKIGDKVVGSKVLKIQTVETAVLFLTEDKNLYKVQNNEIINMKNDVVDFEVRNNIMFLVNDGKIPTAEDINGKLIAEFKDVKDAEMCAVHRSLPTVAFATRNGSIVMFRNVK